MLEGVKVEFQLAARAGEEDEERLEEVKGLVLVGGPGNRVDVEGGGGGDRIDEEEL